MLQDNNYNKDNNYNRITKNNKINNYMDKGIYDDHTWK